MFAGSFLSSGQNTTSQVLTTAIFDNTSSDYYQDAVSLATGTTGAATLSTNLEIGGQQGGLATWHGHIQEVIVYPTDQTANRAAIEIEINARYSIY